MFNSIFPQFCHLNVKQKQSNQSPVSDAALSCGWQSLTCGRCLRCRGRASPHAPTSSPAPWALGSYHWPGDTLALRSADRQSPRHSVDLDKEQQSVSLFGPLSFSASHTHCDKGSCLMLKCSLKTKTREALTGKTMFFCSIDMILFFIILLCCVWFVITCKISLFENLIQDNKYMFFCLFVCLHFIIKVSSFCSG